MSVATAIAAGRVAKAARMTNSCTVGRPGTETTDPVTGVVTTPLTTYLTTVCYLPKNSLQATENNLTDAAALIATTVTVELPWNTTGITRDDVITLTASTTPANVGARFRVVAGPSDDDATALRVQCQELT